jgi:hypothetical protein
MSGPQAIWQTTHASTAERRRKNRAEAERQSGGWCHRCKVRPVGLATYSLPGLDMSAALCWSCIYGILDSLGLPVEPEYQALRQRRLEETERHHL